MLTDANGARVYDAVSSIWTCLHGHAHPRIVAAIAAQAATLDHATTLGATNPPALALAERLCALTGLDRAFFASDGASAIEAAIKMAVQFWQNRGEPQRRRILHLSGSYHGDTVGAMSVSDIAVFKERFAGLCFEAATLEAYVPGENDGDVAAIVVEPLVQAAAGLRVVDAAAYAPLSLPRAPLLVVDEIATGFGRTGTLFAYEQLGLAPDLLCVGKSLTGGTLALSATLATAAVYDAFVAPETAQNRHFFHGHSFAGNPIACAAALASLDLFDVEDTLAQARTLGDAIERHAGALATHAAVREVRRRGVMCGIVVASPDDRTPPAPFAWAVADRLYERGIFTRPIGPVVQLVPPLSSTTAEIDAFFEIVAGVLDAAA